MNWEESVVLRGERLFRKGELVYINRSDELKEYCNILHRHDFIEIAYVIKGRGMHIVGDSEYETGKGDLYIINYDVPHMFVSNQKEELVVYNCAFMPGFLDAALFSSHHFEDITSSFLFNSIFAGNCTSGPDLKLNGTGFVELGDLFVKMYMEYKSCEKGSVDLIRAYLIQLIVRIFRYMDHDSKNSMSGTNKELMEKAIAYLRDNYSTDIRLDDLAMKAFISKNYFSRLFKETTGINFSDYLQKLRLEEACNLLSNTDYKVTDVATRVGFKDLKFFYEVFKRFTRKTPGQYRRSSGSG